MGPTRVTAAVPTPSHPLQITPHQVVVQFEAALKGHGFSRAVSRIFIAALAAEGRQFSNCTTTRTQVTARPRGCTKQDVTEIEPVVREPTRKLARQSSCGTITALACLALTAGTSPEDTSTPLRERRSLSIRPPEPPASGTVHRECRIRGCGSCRGRGRALYIVLGQQTEREPGNKSPVPATTSYYYCS
jgi:hypothetical protein